MTLGNMQLGKQGITDNFIENLRLAFKTHGDMKIHVLKSVGHEKSKVKEIAEEIVDRLGKNFTYKIIGFTIFVKKWRKPKR